MPGIILPTISLKICSRCNTEHPATTEFFLRHKTAKNGLNPACHTCRKRALAEYRRLPEQKAKKAEYNRSPDQKAKKAARRALPEQKQKNKEAISIWRAENAEHVRAYKAKYHASIETDDARAKRLEYAKNYNAGRKQISAAYSKSWRSENKDRMAEYRRNNSVRINASYMRKYRTVLWHNLRHKIGSRLRSMLVNKASRRTEDILGYTREDLISHLEKQFTKGMSWEKVLSGAVHIDHITAVSSFKVETVDCEDFRACWALANLRPLWAKDNLSKGAQITHLI